MLDPILLFADLGDLIYLGLVLIFVLGPLLKNMFGGGAAQQPPPQRRPPQRPPQQKPGAGAGAAKRLESEIEEFLRKAAGGQPPAREQPIPAEVVRAELVPPEKRREPLTQSNPRQTSTQKRQEQPLNTRTAKRTTNKQPATRRNVTTRAQTKKSPTPQRRPLDAVGGHDSELGSEIDREIDRMETHVHDVFDHRLGSLGENSGSGSDVDDRGTDSSVWEGSSARQARAAEGRALQTSAIKKMLLEPGNIQQAIILAEILKRPDF